VALCGHATLASAHVLFTHAHYPHQQVAFTTRSGTLTVRRMKDHTYTMRFPYNAPCHLDVASLAPPLAALVAEVVPGGGMAGVTAVAYNATTKKLIVEVASPDLVAAAAPASDRLLAIDQTALGSARVTGVSITAAGTPSTADACAGLLPPPAPGASAGGTPPVDFVSRYFTPWNGIPEDPVNGSSHTILAPYWMHRKPRLSHATSVPGMEDATSPAGTWRHATLRALQASRRRGLLLLQVCERHLDAAPTAASGDDGAAAATAAAAPRVDEANSYVLMGGAACTVVEGKLACDATLPSETV